MNVIFPSSGNGMLDTFGQIIRRALLRVVDQDSGVERIILIAPDKSHWAVTVSNTGVITTTRVG